MEIITKMHVGTYCICKDRVRMIPHTEMQMSSECHQRSGILFQCTDSNKAIKTQCNIIPTKDQDVRKHCGLISLPCYKRKPQIDSIVKVGATEQRHQLSQFREAIVLYYLMITQYLNIVLTSNSTVRNPSKMLLPQDTQPLHPRTMTFINISNRQHIMKKQLINCKR